MPRSLLVFRQCCGAFLFMLFWFRGGLLKIVLVKSLFFGRNGLGHLGLGALLQAGEKSIGGDAALARAPKAGTKKNLRTMKISAMAPTLSRFSTAESWPTTR